MPSITRTRHGHWGHRSLEAPGDPSVSHDEQQDRLPSVGAPEGWMLIVWAISPLIAIAIGSLLGHFFLNKF